MMSLPPFGKCLILSSGGTISGNLGGTEQKQLNILAFLHSALSDGNILTALLHLRIFCCDHRPTPEYPSPRPRLMSRLTSKSKCLYIARQLIEQLPLAYISTERTAVHVPRRCSHKYQPAFRSLLNLCTIDRYRCAIYLERYLSCTC